LEIRSGLKPFVLTLKIAQATEDDDPTCNFRNNRRAFFLNPERIEAFSPRLARREEGLPGVIVKNGHNPERVAHPKFGKSDATLSGLEKFLRSPPGVARSSQPQADSFNPVGIEHARTFVALIAANA